MDESGELKNLYMISDFLGCKLAVDIDGWSVLDSPVLDLELLNLPLSLYVYRSYKIRDYHVSVMRILGDLYVVLIVCDSKMRYLLFDKVNLNAMYLNIDKGQTAKGLYKSMLDLSVYYNKVG